MPSFRIHLIGGAAAFLAANYIAYGAGLGSQSAAIFAAAILGAVFPDVDERHTRQFRAVLVVLCTAAFVFAFSFFPDSLTTAVAAGVGLAAAVGLAAVVVKPRHRGIVHTYLLAFAFAVVVFFLRGADAAFAGLLGYASHLVLDRLF